MPKPKTQQSPRYKMIRITEDAHEQLRRLYVETGETLTEIASRLIRDGARQKR